MEKYRLNERTKATNFDKGLTSHRVDLAAFTGFSQEFDLIIIHPVKLWAALEHLYNRASKIF